MTNVALPRYLSKFISHSVQDDMHFSVGKRVVFKIKTALKHTHTRARAAQSKLR